MKSGFITFTRLAAMAVLLFAVSARADDLGDAKEQVHELWNVDAMMKQASANIARRYNMNEYQAAETQKMLTREVTKFMESHEEIWPLLRDLSRFQMAGRAPEGEVAKKLGAAAKPLMDEIKGAIYDANAEWRNLLTEEQKRLHDWDLQDIDRTFTKMNENFDAMSQGERVNQGVFPQPNSQEGMPSTPKKPDDKFKPRITDEIRVASRQRSLWDAWDLYVKNFIQDYELDPGQVTAAWSIHREAVQRAERYWDTNRDRFQLVEQKLAEARNLSGKEQVERMRLWKETEQRLQRPIHEIFQELKERLDRLPRDAQKRAAYKKGRRPVIRKPEAPIVSDAGASAESKDDKVEVKAASDAPEKTTPDAGNQGGTNGAAPAGDVSARIR